MIGFGFCVERGTRFIKVNLDQRNLLCLIRQKEIRYCICAEAAQTFHVIPKQFW